ncbi:cytochrome c4 [Pseudomonas fluorescens group sp.]|uniref:Cytochrome c4 n=2 Tax=Pseudomonas fluorescens TaxID=294 RepID=C3K6T2_PSEFS|nr:MULTISPECIES: cytochrome c4 [Pseudomonas fluorescens group]MBZ6454767.1 cytochrome c4 [Pseudomonas fluorescens group sp.]MBZ6464189.1 cytochrome c4 [Pseudomonas fluorescens group sp.]MBZ6470699.1 cytochrome c4 [Pseudomonas fluorescens group sp.]WQD72455.1 cytochrome c4 [Pseudomonas marginalis]CAI2794423.1 Cytochrome c4 [Pseudomonas fluorescens SBW25]
MNKLIVSLLLTLGITGAAVAAEGPLKGDATAGQAKAAVCGACHGPDGNSPAPNFPKLAGQGERYLTKQLHDIKDGKRTVLEMTGLLTTLSDQDLADLAAYFASQKGSVGAADPKLVARGEKLFRGGDLEKGLPACTGCHSPNGAGIAAAGFPHLSGQHATYIAKQLTDFRKEEAGRANDGDAAIMRTIARKLSDEDIAAVSSYIQGLH